MYESIEVFTKNKIFRNLYEQMNRISRCFQNINQTLVAQSNGVMCEVRSNGELEWYTYDSSTKEMSWYVCDRFDHIQSKSVLQQIQHAEEAFSLILREAIKNHQQYTTIKRCKMVLDNITTNYNNIKSKEIKKNSVKEELIKQSSEFSKLSQQREEITRRRGSHIVSIGDNVLHSHTITERMDEINQSITKLSQSLASMDKQIKHSLLELDEQTFHLVQALSDKK
jgi:hypothetical protein